MSNFHVKFNVDFPRQVINFPIQFYFACKDVNIHRSIFWTDDPFNFNSPLFRECQTRKQEHVYKDNCILKVEFSNKSNVKKQNVGVDFCLRKLAMKKMFCLLIHIIR